MWNVKKKKYFYQWLWQKSIEYEHGKIEKKPSKEDGLLWKYSSTWLSFVIWLSRFFFSSSPSYSLSRWLFLSFWYFVNRWMRPYLYIFVGIFFFISFSLQNKSHFLRVSPVTAKISCTYTHTPRDHVRKKNETDFRYR